MKTLALIAVLIFAALSSAFLIWFFLMAFAFSAAVNGSLYEGAPNILWWTLVLVTGGIVMAWIVIIVSLIKSRKKNRNR